MSVRRTGRATPAHRILVALLAFAGAAILHDPGVLAAQGVVRGRVVDASTGDTVAVTTVQLHNEAGETRYRRPPRPMAASSSRSASRGGIACTPPRSGTTT